MKIILLATLALSLTACGLGGGCDASPDEAEVSLYVTDAATGAAVRQPTFASYGTALVGRCQGPSGSDALVCESWVLVGPPAKQEITIAAPGYKPAIVDVDTTSVSSIHLGVELETL